MVAWAPIVGAGIAAGSLLGKKKSGGNPMLEAAMREFTALEGRQPTEEEMRVQIEKYIQAGLLTPEQAQTFLMGPSAYEDIELDPTTRAAEMDALRQLSDISNEGGLTDAAKARILAINDEFGTANRGAQEAIVQNAQERGVSGSGLELAARLSAEQNNARMANLNAAKISADAEDRALQAMIQKANIGGQVRSADFEQEARKAAARDAIEQFNTQNKQAVNTRNVDTRNAAQQFNLTNKQNVSNANVEAENANRVRNADLKQRVFENRMNIARGKSGQLNQMAALEDKERDRDEAFNNALLGVGATLMGSK